MPALPQVSGPCETILDTGTSRALESLGWTANGVSVQRRRLTTNIPGDQNGGDDGVPIEIQDFGGTVSVRLELTKWDSLVAAKVRRLGNPNGTGFSGVSLGGIVTPGTFIVANGGYYRLLLKPLDTSYAMNFLCAIPEGEPEEINLSSKFMRLNLSFTCYPIAGTIWNQVLT